jgi:DNA-binding LytR/AlgR family response regulator
MKSNDKIKTIIIDDESQWQLIVRKFVEKTPELALQNVFSDVETAYDYLQENDVDLICLDMEINDDIGINLIKRLDKKYAVIIISSHETYAIQGFSISAVDYVQKPIEFEKFKSAIQKAILYIQWQKSTTESSKSTLFEKDYFLIKEDNNMLRVNFKDVLCINALENYIKIITTSKAHIVLINLSQFERSFSDNPFLRIHRSHIVNLNYIKMVSKDTCTLTNGQELPIGDMYRNEVNEVFIEGKVIKR